MFHSVSYGSSLNILCLHCFLLVSLKNIMPTEFPIGLALIYYENSVSYWSSSKISLPHCFLLMRFIDITLLLNPIDHGGEMVRDVHPVGHHGYLHLPGGVHPPPQRRHQRHQRVHGGH